MKRDTLEREARRIADETQLSNKEAIVLVGTRNDYSEKELSILIGRAKSTVRSIQRNLEDKHRKLTEDRTQSVLSGADWP